ncbi:MAG: hypothetical protein DHS20C21_15610 [Gemmatimonadota bacterium]|nr:MAG: hypothetical protein DHS20C21_15610 [Gemmatimonadota bacterium]
MPSLIRTIPVSLLGLSLAYSQVPAQTLSLAPEELLTASSTWTTNQRPRVVFTEDGAKHLAWIATNTFGSEGVFIVDAASAGSAYGAAVQLTTGMPGVRYGIGDGLELKVNGPNLLATWEGTDFANRPMWFSRSTDQGVSWEGEVRADDATVEERAYTTGTLFPDGRVAKVWIHYDSATGEPDHQFRAQDEFGVFGAPSNPAVGSPDVPCECCTADPIILEDGTVLVAYRNNENNRRKMYVSRSTDGGATFPSSVRVDSGGTIFFACPGSPPSITAEGQDVLVVWGKVGGLPAAYHTMSARSTDGGTTFAPQVQIDESDGTTNISSPMVTRRGNLAIAVWKGKDPVTGQFEIWAGTSMDGGSFWGPEQMLTGDGLARDLGHPSAAISPAGDVEIAWMDARDFTEKVYHRGATLNPTATPEAPISRGSLVAAPNPFRASTTLQFAATGGATRLVTIVDVAGRQVARLSGIGTIRWDGRDESGATVPAGVYFARPEGGAREDAVRIVRLR